MRFRHKALGTIVTTDNPDWAARNPQYEPVVPTAPRKVPTLDDVTKAELVDEAKRRGLPVSGTKAELIERLKP